MSSKQDQDKRVEEQQQRRDATRTRPSQPNGSPLLNDGPELVRDSNC
jgi:hypothetical protein